MEILMLGGLHEDFIVFQSTNTIPYARIEWRSTLTEGLGYLESNAVDVAVLDITPSGRYGVADLNQLQLAFPTLPVVVLGQDDNTIALDAISHGAQDYLPVGKFDHQIFERSLLYAITRKHQETRLRHTENLQNEDQFRSAFTYAAIGIALVGLDGKWLQVNPALCIISGYTEAELLTKTFQDITHPDDLDADLSYVRQLIAGKIQTYQMEKRYFHKLGHEICVLLNVSLVRTSDGQPLHFISQIQDITERKRTQALLHAQMEEAQETQNNLKSLHEITIELTNTRSLDDFYKRSVELGIKRLGFDRLGLLLYDSHTALAIGTYGTDAGGMIVAEHHLRIDPASLTGILMRALNKEERFVVDAHTELFSDSKSIGMGWNAAAVLWNGSEKLGWLAIDNGVKHLPMTQTQLNILALYALTLGTLLAHKQSEIHLMQEHDLLRTLIDTLPDFIFIKDLAGRFMLSNRALAHASNFTPDEMVGKTVYDTLPFALAQQVQADEEHIIATGEPMISAERTIVAQNGENRIVLGTKVLVRDKDGNIMSLLGISHDITERKQLEAQTIELATERGRIRLLQRFISDMSHDFRTPLSIINSSLYLLKKSTDHQKQLTYANRAEQQVIRLDKLLEELLLMQRLDDEMSLQLNMTDMNVFLPPIIHAYESVAMPKRISITYLPYAEPCFAKVDTVELGRAITKLMDNAILYSPEGAHIILRAYIEANHVVIALQDTGMGIAESDLPHIFERFYRADQARSSTTGGSGVGLSIVQKIVEAHNGHLDVESTVGKGSTFFIKLPTS